MDNNKNESNFNSENSSEALDHPEIDPTESTLQGQDNSAFASDATEEVAAIPSNETEVSTTPLLGAEFASQEPVNSADVNSASHQPSPPKPFPEPDHPLSGPGNGTPRPKKVRKPRKPLSPLVKTAGVATLISLIIGGSAGAVVAHYSSSNTPTTPTTSSFSANKSVIASPTDIQGILSKVEPAVVDIQTTGTINQGGMFGGSQQFQAAGTGMIMTANGEVLTNNHVIANASTIKVQLFNQTKLYNATVVGTDPSHDIAVIKIEGVSNLPTVSFGKSSSLQVGDSVVAVGNALALQGLPTVTQGIVSGLHRSITTGANVSTGSTQLTDMIQTDAPINPGNSGGPLVNSSGQVIGMNTAIISGTGSEPAQNIGFAEAIDSVLPIVHQIETHPNSSTGIISGGKAFLGVGVETLNAQIAAQLGLPSNLSGVLVANVVPGSPANNAGITAGSVITKVDGKKVTTAGQLVTIVQKKSPGSKITVDWTNSNGTGSAVVTLGSAPTA